MNFSETDKKIFRDFPNVFSNEYKVNASRFAEQLKVMDALAVKKIYSTMGAIEK